METSKDEEHEALGVVITFYVFSLFLSSLAISHDCISKKWRTVRETRFKSKLHLVGVIVSLAVSINYIYVQGNGGDYKEMSAGIIGFLFALLHSLRTFLGLWELHCFEQWALSCIKSIYSLQTSTLDSDSNSTRWNFKEYQQNTKHYQTIDNIVVNDSIIENRLFEGDVRCFIHYLPPEMRQKLKGKKWGYRLLKHIMQITKAIFNIPLLIFCIFFNVDEKFRDSSDVPFLSVQKPEEVWIRWSTLLLVYCKKSLIPLNDEHVSCSISERREFLQSLVLQCSLNVCNEENYHFALPYDVWCKMASGKNPLLCKDEILKYTGSSGLGLPFGTPHCSENLQKSSSYGYDMYSERLRRFQGELPVHKWDFAKCLQINDLEWFLVLTSVKVWSPNDALIDKSNYRIAFTFFKKIRNSIYNLSLLCEKARRKGNYLDNDDLNEEELPLKRDYSYRDDLRYENFLDQLGLSCSNTSIPIVDNIPRAFIEKVMYKLFRENETVLEVSYHLDNWIALTVGSNCIEMDKYFRLKKNTNIKELYLLETDNMHDLFKANSELEMVSNMFSSTDILHTRSLRFIPSLKFLGCGMEEIRSALMKQIGEIDKWDRNVETIVKTWTEISYSKDFEKLLNLQRYRIEFNNIQLSTTFKMRLLWELQNCFWDNFDERKRNSIDDLLCLCILYFPSLNIIRTESCLQESVYFFKIIPVGSPQDFYVLVKVRETTCGWLIRAGLRSNKYYDGQIFKWESWKNAFMGRLEGARKWKEECKISSSKNDGSELYWEFSFNNSEDFTHVASPFDDTRKIKVWRGWLPHKASISKFEVKSALSAEKYKGAIPDQLSIGVHSVRHSIREIVRNSNTNRTFRSSSEYLAQLKQKADNLRDQNQFRLAQVLYENAALNYGDSYSLIQEIKILKQDNEKKKFRYAAEVIEKYCARNSVAKSCDSICSKTAFEQMYNLVQISNYDLDVAYRFAFLCLKFDYCSNRETKFDYYSKARFALFTAIASDHGIHEQNFLNRALETLSQFNVGNDLAYSTFSKKLQESIGN